MILADLSSRKRHDVLWLALSFVLQDLRAPCDTATICDALARRTETSEKAVIARWLMKVSSLVPEASHTGGSFQRAGRTMKRWVWSPRGTNMVPASAGPVDEETPEAYRARIVAEGARREALAQDLQSAKANVSDEDW